MTDESCGKSMLSFIYMVCLVCIYIYIYIYIHTHTHTHTIQSTEFWPEYTGQNNGVGSLSLLQGIFPTQGSNPGLPHCRWIFYQLSHNRSPKILGWVSLSLLQWIFPTQESNPGLLHYRQMLYQLSYEGSP